MDWEGNHNSAGSKTFCPQDVTVHCFLGGLNQHVACDESHLFLITTSLFVPQIDFVSTVTHVTSKRESDIADRAYETYMHTHTPILDGVKAASFQLSCFCGF